MVPLRQEGLCGAVVVRQQDPHRAAILLQPRAHLGKQGSGGRGRAGRCHTQATGQLHQVDPAAQQPPDLARVLQLGEVTVAHGAGRHGLGRCFIGIEGPRVGNNQRIGPAAARQQQGRGAIAIAVGNDPGQLRAGRAEGGHGGGNVVCAAAKPGVLARAVADPAPVEAEYRNARSGQSCRQQGLPVPRTAAHFVAASNDQQPGVPGGFIQCAT